MSISINFDRVTFSYPEGDLLFSDLSITLPADKTIILCGANGAGKSTLALLAAGLLSPRNGRITHLGNRDKSIKKSELYSHLCILKQSGMNNILCPNPVSELKTWFNCGKSDESKISKSIDSNLQLWGLYEKRLMPVWELSAGEIQALALAGISLHMSRYWILDEPHTSLDSVHTSTLLHTLATKQTHRRGMLIVAHQIELFASLADEIWTLSPRGVMAKSCYCTH